jgi:hypothetical protein
VVGSQTALTDHVCNMVPPAADGSCKYPQIVTNPVCSYLRPMAHVDLFGLASLQELEVFSSSEQIEGLVVSMTNGFSFSVPDGFKPHEGLAKAGLKLAAGERFTSLALYSNGPAELPGWIHAETDGGQVRRRAEGVAATARRGCRCSLRAAHPAGAPTAPPPPAGAGHRQAAGPARRRGEAGPRRSVWRGHGRRLLHQGRVLLAGRRRRGGFRRPRWLWSRRRGQ